jgi:hypothetical protein
VSVIDDISAALVRAVEKREDLPAREAAEAAWYPGHPLGTVDAIEAAIIRRRTEDAELIAHMDNTRAA